MYVSAQWSNRSLVDIEIWFERFTEMINKCVETSLRNLKRSLHGKFFCRRLWKTNVATCFCRSPRFRYFPAFDIDTNGLFFFLAARNDRTLHHSGIRWLQVFLQLSARLTQILKRKKWVTITIFYPVACIKYSFLKMINTLRVQEHLMH